MHAADHLRSIPGICDLSWHPPRGGGAPQGPALLIEIPHGATEIADYEAVAAELRSSLPPQLEAFFYVNTDIGAPECAERVAAALSEGEAPVGVLVARCRIPRTFIDCNRVAAGIPGVVVDGLTPAVASYVDDPDDRAALEASHRRYHEVVARAYDLVCAGGRGLALQLHSYAPVSVDIPVIDRDIVDKLRWAYTPEVLPRWRRRPDVDVICEAVDGAALADPGLVDGLLSAYRDLDLEVGASATYRLHPATMGYHYARRFPGQVVCVELSRGRLADPFVPLARSPLSATEIERLAAPLARVLGGALRGSLRA